MPENHEILIHQADYRMFRVLEARQERQTRQGRFDDLLMHHVLRSFTRLCCDARHTTFLATPICLQAEILATTAMLARQQEIALSFEPRVYLEGVNVKKDYKLPSLSAVRSEAARRTIFSSALSAILYQLTYFLYHSCRCQAHWTKQYPSLLRAARSCGRESVTTCRQHPKIRAGGLASSVPQSF